MGQDLDSTAVSGHESDSSDHIDSPDIAKHERGWQDSLGEVSGRADEVSPFLSPIIYDGTKKSGAPGLRQIEPGLVIGAMSRTPSPLCLSSQPPQPRHPTSHPVDSLLISPSPLHMPYHILPSPLAPPPLTYIRLPPLHQHLILPHERVSHGLTFSLDIKPLF